MNKYRTIGIFFLFAICFSGVVGQGGTIRINEFMAINHQTLTDEDGDYSDWIELFNYGSEKVDLNAWSLSGDITLPRKWNFQNLEIGPGEYLLVFASGKDRNFQGNELHTNFKLSGTGEYLALVNQNDSVVSSFDPSYPAQMADVSMGYLDGSFIMFALPTPGQENFQGGVLLPEPKVTVNHGIFNTPFSLELLSEVQDAVLFYSLDGSTPNAESGIPYVSPVYIDSTTILRVVSVLDDTLYSSILTQSYIFLEDIIHQSNNPEGYPALWGPYTAIDGSAE